MASCTMAWPRSAAGYERAWWTPLSKRSFMSSYGRTSSTKRHFPLGDLSQDGRPEGNLSSTTQSRKLSQMTGQPSSRLYLSLSSAFASSVVAGVMRSTIEFGNITFSEIHVAKAPSTAPAISRTAMRAFVPFSWRLSQLRMAKPPAPSLRRAAVATRKPAAVFNAVDPLFKASMSLATGGAAVSSLPVAKFTKYPFSVTVKVTIFVSGALSAAIAAAGSSGARMKLEWQPMIRTSSDVAPLCHSV
mmetsp:Transcript_56567/g.132160  ORF Transcript_56567/g.132160 Transcript_56567/m.132160 type:complete len:245 (+) Transcript_56567:118-852(+)